MSSKVEVLSRKSPRSRVAVLGTFLALVLLTTGLVVPAQGKSQNPQPAGTLDVYFFVENVGAVQQLTILNPVNCGVVACPTLPPVTLNNPIPTSINSRSFQTPVNPRIATTPTAGGGVAAAVVGVAPATNTLEVVDYTGGVPAASTTVGLTGFAGPVPYNVLSDGAGSFFVFEDLVTGFGVSVLSRVSQNAAGAWVVAASATVPQAATPWASEMALSGTNLVVPLLGGVGIYNANSLVPIAVVPTAPFDVGTNIATGMVNPSGNDLLLGLRLPGFGAGHSYLELNSVTGAFLAPVTDPFGAGLALAPGFHEIAVSESRTVATLPLVNTVPFVGGGGGAVGQLSPSPTGVGWAASSSVLRISPFGNPESRRAGTGDPVTMYASDILGNHYLVATGTGTVNPLGATTDTFSMLGGPMPFPGPINFAATDRPLSMAASFDVMTVDSSPGTQVFTLGAGPTIALTSTYPGPVGGGASSMGSVLLGGGVPAAPVGFQGFSGPGVLDDQLLTGGFLGQTVTPFNDFPMSVPIAAPGALVFTLVPPPAAGVGLFSARQPRITIFTTGGGLILPNIVYPSTTPVATSALKFQLSGLVYFSTGLIVSELGGI